MKVEDEFEEADFGDSFSALPGIRGDEILAILIEVDPIGAPEKEYLERVEKFCFLIFYRRILQVSTPTAEYIRLAVERMFTPAEIVDGDISASAMSTLKHRITSLYIK